MRVLSLIAPLVLAWLSSSFVPAAPLLQCQGCVGYNDPTATDSNSPLCPNCTISVHATVAKGTCVELVTYPGAMPTCLASDCQVTVDRTWYGFITQVYLDFCNSLGTKKRCIYPPIPTGPGFGSDVEQYGIECGTGPWTWDITSVACNLGASVTGGCTGCFK